MDASKFSGGDSISAHARCYTAATIDVVKQLAGRLLATGIWDQDDDDAASSPADQHSRGTMGGGKQKAVLVTSFDENKVCATCLVVHARDSARC